MVELKVSLTEETQKALAEFVAAATKFGEDVEKASSGKAAPKGKKAPTKAAKKKELEALGKDAREKLRKVGKKRGIDKARELLKSLGANVCGDLDEEGLRAMVALCDPLLEIEEELKEEKTGEEIFE